MPQLLARSETLFIMDNIVVDKGLNKRHSLLELAISGRHCDHYLWLLTQSYSSIPKNLRRQAKTIFVWCPKERGDLKIIHDENNALTDDELVSFRDFVRTWKHAWLYVRNEHTHGFNALNHVWKNHFFKWAKKTHLTLPSIPPFIVTITIFPEYRCSSISRSKLFFSRKYIVTFTLKTSVQRVFKCFLWFFKFLYDTFYPFPWLNQKQDVEKWNPYLF